MQRLFIENKFRFSALAARSKSHTKEPVRHLRLIGLLLALTTLVAYLPVAHHGFSIFDDDDYVTGNHVVQNGLTWVGVKWAFTTWHAGNWHPVTWLSHMTDCELFGLNAGAHHLVNVLFHIANAVLLLLLLFRMTGALWPSAFVAALFAWHPLHVESVAWIAERKDVLSTFFALLTLLAYARYTWESKVRSPKSKVFYGLSLLAFALGLMSKPMLVTLPFVMLLLDYWPLQRLSPSAFRFPLFLRLALEKWPFFLLAAASCIVTFLAQYHGGMVASLEKMPLGYRLANVPLAYMRYLLKMIWPVHLAFFYPLPKEISPLTSSAAVVALISVTVVVWFGRKRSPYGLMGWLWFLGTLVPVIGLVQVGQAAMSDRYTYFPFIGMFIAIAFAARDWGNRFKIPPPVITTAVILILGSCVLLTENQLAYRRDDQSLFTHAISVTKDNEPAHLCLGLALEGEGRKADAIAEYRIGLKLNPYRVRTYNDLARVLAESGRTNEALAELREALRIDSTNTLSHNHLASLLAESGHTNEALAEFRETLQINPQDAPAHNNLANLLVESGRTNEALAEFREALLTNHKDVALYNNLGILLVELGRFDEAMEQYGKAARLDPTDWHAPYLMGKALLKQGRDAEAVNEFRASLRLDPDNFQILAYTAHVLASDENPRVRNGQIALEMAVKANDLTGGAQPFVLDALGMAYAELGQFDDAQKAAQNALYLIESSGMTNDVAVIQQRLQLYKNHQPFRQRPLRKFSSGHDF